MSVPTAALFASPFLPVSLPIKGAIAGGSLSWYISEMSLLSRFSEIVFRSPSRNWKQIAFGVILSSAYGAAAFKVLNPTWATAFLLPSAVLFAKAIHSDYPCFSELPPIDDMNRIHQAIIQRV